MSTASVRSLSRGIVIAALILTLNLAGCAKATVEETEDRIVPVEVITVAEETRPQYLTYLGILQAKTLTKHSFKSGGQIAKIHVEKGERVRRGQVLATLDTTELNMALEASALTVEKARQAYADAERQYRNLTKLLEAGAVAQNDVDQAKLHLDVRQADYRQAQIDYELKQKMLDDAVLKAEDDGYVADILFEEGEIAGAGYPVVVTRGLEVIVNVGLTQQDAAKVKKGSAAQVDIQGTKVAGKVVRVSALPDETTHTYNAEIALQGEVPEPLYLGSTVEVRIAVGEGKGIWVPINAVQNDGEDYVYVVENGRAMRKTVKLGPIQGFEVQVQGLSPGETLVVAGMKELRQGFKVAVKETVD